MILLKREKKEKERGWEKSSKCKIRIQDLNRSVFCNWTIVRVWNLKWNRYTYLIYMFGESKKESSNSEQE